LFSAELLVEVLSTVMVGFIGRAWQHFWAQPFIQSIKTWFFLIQIFITRAFMRILMKFENVNLKKPTNPQFTHTQDCVHSGDRLFYRDHNLCRKSPRRAGRVL